MLNLNIKSFILKYRSSNVVFKATLWFVICSFIQRGILIFTTPLFTRLLTPEEYGQYTIYISWIQVFTILTTLKLTAGGFNKAMSKFPDGRNEFVATNQSLTSIITLFFFIFYLIFIEQINRLTELTTLVSFAMITELFFSPAINFWMLKQRYEYKYKSAVVISLLMVFLNAILGVLAVWLAMVDKGYARIYSCTIVPVVFGMYFYIHNFRMSKTLFNREYAKYAMAFCLPLLPHYLSIYVLEQSDRIMIQKINGFSETGLYGVAHSAGLLMKIFTESLTTALVPWMYSKLENGETYAIKRRIRPMLNIMLGFMLMFVLIAPELFLLFAGKQYYASIYVIPPVALSIFFVFVYTIFANVEFFYECRKFTMYISSFGAIVNIVFNFLFIPHFGFVAAGYTTLLTYTIFSFGHFLYMLHILRSKKLDPVLTKRDMMKSLIFVVCIILLAAVLYKTFIIRLIVLIIVSTIMIVRRKEIKHRIVNFKKDDTQV